MRLLDNVTEIQVHVMATRFHYLDVVTKESETLGKL